MDRGEAFVESLGVILGILAATTLPSGAKAARQLARSDDKDGVETSKRPPTGRQRSAKFSTRQ